VTSGLEGSHRKEIDGPSRYSRAASSSHTLSSLKQTENITCASALALIYRRAKKLWLFEVEPFGDIVTIG